MRAYNFSCIGWAWHLALLLAICPLCAADTTFDSLPLIEQHAQHLTSSNLAEALSIHADILAKHNIRREAHALQQYVEQLRAVLQPDCCDYFTALPTVKGLATSLSEVLDLRLPAASRPVLRRSYVGAIWLLQRSRFFKWDTSALQKSALSGMQKLYDEHVAAASGRPSKFHHISKAGGTTLCYLAFENGCSGPGMSKKDNCLLDISADSPVWVLRHNVTVANRLAPIPPLPPPPPLLADPVAEAGRLRLVELSQRIARSRSYDWWMYDCIGGHPSGRLGRPCSELQEGAIAKSATFFATENALPTEHGQPRLCEEFLNVVVMREAVSEVVSLMNEVSTVYTRLLRQHRVLGWAAPKWDLTWWQQWAPLVINSYATRTLLGSAAYCPAVPQQQQPSAAPVPNGRVAATRQGSDSDAGGDSSSYSRELRSISSVDSSGGGGTRSSGSSSSSGNHPWSLSEDDVVRALHVLASFDVVLDLSSRELMDASVGKLLGWTAKSYRDSQHQRNAHAITAPPWDQLELMARQLPPPLTASLLPVVPEGADQEDGPSDSSSIDGRGSAELTPDEAAALDDLRRLIGEVRVRQVYSSNGMGNLLQQLGVEVPRLQPSAAVVAAAVAALAAAKQGGMSVRNTTDSSGNSHLLVQLQVGKAGEDPAAAAAAAVNSTAVGAWGGTSGVVSYHVWPTHGVVLTERQHQQLLQATAADARLYRTSRVLQALDAGWVSVLSEQRKVRKLLLQVEQDAKKACGFAGLNHMQQ